MIDTAPGLFEHLPEHRKPAPTFGDQGYPVWSKNKSLLIERYLYYFVMVTRHGCYIDGFAGPQRDNEKDLWSAKRVLERRPKWLKTFVLCDLKPKQIRHLQELKDAQPPRGPNEPKRTIAVLEGDFNQTVDEALDASKIKGKKIAAFCLLDQRTFECHWSTVAKVAAYRPDRKIELFYLLPINWLKRSIAATQNKSRLRAWWGGDDWTKLRSMAPAAIAELVCQRFRKEFQYTSVQAWPVRRSQHSNRIMYFMIHATDHSEAPKLMRRAFKKTDSRDFEDLDQIDLEDFLKEG
jgi:three-Cys-motif partner protein